MVQAEQSLERVCIVREAAQVLGFVGFLARSLEQTEFPIDQLN